MKNLTSDKIIEFFYDQKPKIVWECGDDVLAQLRFLHDANGQNLYQQRDPRGDGLKTFNEVTFLGYPLYRIKGMEGRLILKYIFKGGFENSIEFI